MSTSTREALVARLHFNDSQARADLLDEHVTDTLLIQMLDDVADRCKHPILITAVRRDHGLDSYLGRWGHVPIGALTASVDCYIADWATVGDAKIVDLALAALASPYVWSIGFGGDAYTYCRGLLSTDPRVVVFQDNGSDHMHLQAGNGHGSGHR